MIDTASRDTIRRERRRGAFVYPDYGRYSLAELVPTILTILGVDPGRAVLPDALYRDQAAGCDRVVLLLVDGLGYDQLVTYQERYPLFQRLLDRGTLHALTSVFPSTTAA